ncbi:MAG: hypothetical protein HYV19_03810 [Gemmatimonadetes bacterium]|nr:hypothetical protein [Gemmatimonadota bacterium]
MPAGTSDSALAQRAAKLRERARLLDDSLKALRAASADSGLTVVVEAEGLRVRTTTTLRPDATAALGVALADARPLLGAQLDSLSRHMTLTLREQRSTMRLRFSSLIGRTGVPTESYIASATLDGAMDALPLPSVGLHYPLDRAELAATLVMQFERAAAQRVPPALSSWLNKRLPLRAEHRKEDAELFRMLATSNAAVVRRCVAGDRDACRTGFALDSMPTDRVASWYETSDLPALAGIAGDASQRGELYRAFGADGQAQCTVQRQLDVCRRMVALLPLEAFQVPMPVVARLSLARTALEMGGPAALERLRSSDTTSIGAQLAAAAGASSEALLERWMKRVIGARPSSPLPNAVFVLASLAVIAVCLGWAMRGQPWK